MRKIKKHLLILILLLIPISNFSQKKEIDSILTIKHKRQIKLDSLTNHAFKNLVYEGYFYYQKLDSIINDSICSYNLKLGPKTKYINFEQNSYIQQFIKSKNKNITISTKEFYHTITAITNVLGTQGKVFNKIVFEPKRMINDTLFGTINHLEEKTRTIDQYKISGYTTINKNYINKLLKLHQDFNNKSLTQIEKKINQLTFIQNISTPNTLFTADSTIVYLYLKKIKDNQIDALFGFGNNNSSNKIKFNGHLNLVLNNLRDRGEHILLQWNNNGQGQEEIKLNTALPYIFNSPFIFEYRLNTYKNAELFVNNNNLFSIQYPFGLLQNIGSYYQTETSTNYKTSTESYSKNFYGINYKYQLLNNHYEKETYIEIEFGLGKKQTLQNVNQKVIRTEFTKNINITNTQHLYISNKNALLISKSKTINEYFRNGGTNNFRGFLENSILSNEHFYLNIDYRLYVNTNNYVYGFTDNGYFRTPNQNYLQSFGIGYQQKAQNNLFKIAYAVGRNTRDGLNLNQSLIHLNFISIF